jgi:hypothetical protein
MHGQAKPVHDTGFRQLKCRSSLTSTGPYSPSADVRRTDGCYTMEVSERRGPFNDVHQM